MSQLSRYRQSTLHPAPRDRVTTSEGEGSEARRRGVTRGVGWGAARARLTRAAHALAWTSSLAITVLCWLVVAFEVWVRMGTISPSELDGFSESIRFTDNRGALLREVVGASGARAKWRPLPEISPLLIDATLAVEDARFASHDGIDTVGVLRAMRDNVRARRVVSGASTLTMQLARLLKPSSKTLWGKIHEMMRARRLERAFDKSTILEQYLNRAPYGRGVIGVEAASWRHFGKSNRHLSLAEAAVIAGLPKAPSLLDPHVNPDGAKERQRKVLDRMHATGRISSDEFERAIAQPLVYKNARPSLDAMHFTDHVLSEIRRAREPQTGTVRTTLDRPLQRSIEGAVDTHVRSLAAGNMTNAAVIVLDNRRCEVRVMVGSADYWNPQYGAVNGALAPRQPGSALKPFTYALAMEQAQMTPASVIADIPTEYGDATGALFRPQNFSKTFSGPVLFGDALGRSLNVPAIRVAARVGARALLARLRALGFESLTRAPEHYGLGLTLGNGEVTLLELAGAYATLARGGVRCLPRVLEDEPDAARPNGQISLTPEPERVFSAETSFLITDILSDESLRIAAFGPGNALLLDFPVAIKTGTSSDWRDSWAVGYTRRYTVAVWAGNFDGSSMNHLAGATGAGPLFHTVMSLVVERAKQRGESSPLAPVPPPNVVQVEVCALSGKPPSEHCPHKRQLHVRAADRPRDTCDWHEPIETDRRNQLRAGPNCPDEFVEQAVFQSMPTEYASWQAESGWDAPPTAYSPLCPQSGEVPGSVVITYPRDGEIFLIEPGFARATQSVRLAARADGIVPKVTWTVNGQPVAQSEWPYIAQWPLTPGTHTLIASAPGQRASRVQFEVR